MVLFYSTDILGETYNGHLVNCDGFMNLNLKEVICTSADGEKFWRLDQVHLRGNAIKYLQIPEEVLDQVKEERKSSRGTYSGRGRGSGRGGKSNSDRGGNKNKGGKKGQ